MNFCPLENQICRKNFLVYEICETHLGVHFNMPASASSFQATVLPFFTFAILVNALVNLIPFVGGTVLAMIFLNSNHQLPILSYAEKHPLWYTPCLAAACLVCLVFFFCVCVCFLNFFFCQASPPPSPSFTFFFLMANSELERGAMMLIEIQKKKAKKGTNLLHL